MYENFGRLYSLPIWCVVPEIVVGSLKEHPVEIVEGVLEASKVSQLGRVVGGVLVEVHSPGPSATVASISRATRVTVAAVSLCSGGLVGADTALPILKSGICKSCSIACSDAPEIISQTSELCINGSFFLNITYSSGVLVEEFRIEPANIC